MTLLFLRLAFSKGYGFTTRLISLIRLTDRSPQATARGDGYTPCDRKLHLHTPRGAPMHTYHLQDEFTDSSAERSLLAALAGHPELYGELWVVISK